MLTQDQFTDLGKRVEAAYKSLEKFRIVTKKIVEEWASDRYSDDDTPAHPDVVNNLATAITTFTLHMVPQRPRVNITSDYVQYRAAAANLKIAINNEFENMNIESELEEIVTNAWLRIGISKLGYASGNYQRIGNQMVDVGRLFCKSVSLDNWVHDISGTNFSRCEFYGDRYLITKKELEAMPLYDGSAPSESHTVDHNQDERLKELEQGNLQHYEHREIGKVEVWDLFMPYRREVVTFHVMNDDFSQIKPLRVVKWNGPPEGPYKFLRFNRIPENAIPKGIAPDLLDCHVTINNLMRKNLQNAEDLKTVFGYKGTARNDAESIRDAGNNEFIEMKNPTDVQQFTFGEISQQVHAQILFMDQQFNTQAGNLDLIAGLAPSAGTVGQEQMLQANSSSLYSQYKSKVRTFVREIAKDIAWWRWHDLHYDPVINKQVPGSDVTVQSRLIRQGEFVDYNFDIEPYSLEYNPPDLKLQKITGFLTQFQPYIPMMMQQGVTFNFEKLIRTWADYSSLPELLEILEITEPQEVDNPPMRSGGDSTRTYVRRNESQKTGRGQATDQIQQLMANAGNN